jgi:HSP20 family protein
MNDLSTAPTKQPPAAFDAPIGWLRNEIDRLFDDFRRPMRSVFNFAPVDFGPVPAVEMTEREKDYRITVELPGMREEDITVELMDGELAISGEKREAEERKDKGFMLSERRYGAFERRVALPSDIDADEISAEFSKGVLEITLPKDERAIGRARRIDVKKA